MVQPQVLSYSEDAKTLAPSCHDSVLLRISFIYLITLHPQLSSRCTSSSHVHHRHSFLTPETLILALPADEKSFVLQVHLLNQPSQPKVIISNACHRSFARSSCVAGRSTKQHGSTYTHCLSRIWDHYLRGSAVSQSISSQINHHMLITALAGSSTLASPNVNLRSPLAPAMIGPASANNMVPC